MKLLHWEVNAGPDNVIRVELDKQANVLLMDDINFSSYRSGRGYRDFWNLRIEIQTPRCELVLCHSLILG